MPIWVIMVVGGVFLVAAIVLIVAVNFLDVHTEEQCAHLKDLTERTLQQHQEKNNQDQTTYQYRCGEPQLCYACGSVRNRRLLVSTGNNSNSRAKNPRLSTAGGLLQPLMDAAYGKSSLSSGSLECLSGLSSRRRRIASGLQGGWFNGRSFFRGNGGSDEMQESKVRESVAVAAAGSSDSGCLASASAATGGSRAEPMTTITATITTTTSAPSSTSSTSTGSNTSSDNSGGGDEGGNGCKSIPQRRLVLEIFMCPSSTGDQAGSSTRHTGVRLKLETNASLEGLASLASSGVEPEAEVVASALSAAGLTSIPCGPVQVHEASTSSVVPGTNGPHSRGDMQGSIAAAPLSAIMGHKCELVTQDGKSAVTSKVSSIGGENEGASHCGPSAGQAISTVPPDKRAVGPGQPCSTAPNLVSAVACKTRSSGQSVGTNSPSKGKAKGTCNNSNSCSASATPGCGSSMSLSGTVLKGAHNQASFSQSLDGLGSLRISVLDGGAKSKSMKDCSKGVTAEIASALAALNVDSIGGKGVGMGLNLGPGGSSSEPSGNRPGPTEKVDVVQEEEVHGEGSGSEQIVEDGDEHHPVLETVEEDEGDGNKKEKRKKKNRGRRLKAKAAAVAAAAASVEAQEQHVNGKHCVEPIEIANVAVEMEVGCVCGTPKGACHSNGCPYPFTSSGSMVQRKIKEQYDELVRSNVSKTLTLAQVGRFTTCLVEAKSALQQKSDTIQRRFTIAKSLLSKADKSSFDRLCGQIYGLEIEQKKLEEDTVVYNRLQEQLKLSPAYQKMLEYGRTHFELQPNTGQLIERVDSEEVEISFEELLAQEKKDSFWQKHGPSRSSSMQVS